MGAFNIRALGTDCETARGVAADSKGKLGAAYASSGFSCPLVPERSGLLLHYAYQCVNGPAIVTFEETA